MNRRALQALSVFVFAAVTLSGCGEKAVEKSFTDKHGRACTYVIVEEWDGDKDVGNISCEYPPSPAIPTPSPSPS